MRIGAWKNVRNEISSVDFTINKLIVNEFPTQLSSVDFSIKPETCYSTLIQEAKKEREKVFQRAASAGKTLESITRVLLQEKGPDWEENLEDRQLETLMLFEDALYEETMYMPFKNGKPPNLQNYFLPSAKLAALHRLWRRIVC